MSWFSASYTDIDRKLRFGVTSGSWIAVVWTVSTTNTDGGLDIFYVPVLRGRFAIVESYDELPKP